jgi:hypothetical protein
MGWKWVVHRGSNYNLCLCKQLLKFWEMLGWVGLVCLFSEKLFASTGIYSKCTCRILTAVIGRLQIWVKVSGVIDVEIDWLTAECICKLMSELKVCLSDGWGVEGRWWQMTSSVPSEIALCEVWGIMGKC